MNSEKGRKLKAFPVETNNQALVEAIRVIPGRKHLVLEEGLQSAWLHGTLSPHVDELVVAGIRQSRGLKSDKQDAYALAEKLRVGNLETSVFKAPSQFPRLRERARSLMTLVSDVVRVHARIKSVYRSRGVFVALELIPKRTRPERLSLEGTGMHTIPVVNLSGLPDTSFDPVDGHVIESTSSPIPIQKSETSPAPMPMPAPRPDPIAVEPTPVPVERPIVLDRLWERRGGRNQATADLD